MAQYIAESSSSLHSLIVPTQALVDTQKYYCPFQDRDYCREQSRCNFSHDCQLSTKIPVGYCHFYLANQCLYGQDCKFLHNEPELDVFEDQIDDGTTMGSAYIIAHGRPSFSDNDYEGGVDYGGEAYEDEDDENEDGTSIASADKLEERPSNDGHTRRSKQSNRADSSANSSDHINNEHNNHTLLWWDTTNAESNQHHEPQPASSSRLRATARISHRCAIVAPASSSASSSSSSSSSLATAALMAKLHHISPPYTSTAATSAAAQISNKNSANHLKPNTTTSAASTSTSSSAPVKGAWQNNRLIASIRNNNLVESSPSGSSDGHTSSAETPRSDKDLPLCPYSLTSGECPFPEGRCNYLHGLVCDLCYSACLHPYNEKQRHQHREECLHEHEREMELSFAVQRSKDKVCGICMDTVVEKKPITSSRFGILEKCNHIFCLDCIRKWRGTKTFDSRTIRACPECRVSSDFVVPSKYWIEDQDDKEKLITEYKSALSAKPCRYFKEGKGECPFAGSCFYRHAYPDGRLAVLDAPKPRKRLYGARGPTAPVENYILWNILSSAEDDNISVDEMNDELQSIYDELFLTRDSDSEDDSTGWRD